MTVHGTRVEFAVEQEGVTRLALRDGNTITIRVVVGDVMLVGRNADGTPQYFVQNQIVVFALEPARG